MNKNERASRFEKKNNNNVIIFFPCIINYFAKFPQNLSAHFSFYKNVQNNNKFCEIKYLNNNLKIDQLMFKNEKK